MCPIALSDSKGLATYIAILQMLEHEKGETYGHCFHALSKGVLELGEKIFTELLVTSCVVTNLPA